MSVQGTTLHMRTASTGHTVQQELLNMHKSGVIHIPRLSNDIPIYQGSNDSGPPCCQPRREVLLVYLVVAHVWMMTQYCLRSMYMYTLTNVKDSVIGLDSWQVSCVYTCLTH